MVSALQVATVIVFAILIQPILFCVWKHGLRGLLGWGVIQMFCVVRIVGAILQIIEDKNASNPTAARVVANVGLSPLLLGVLGILHEARTARDPYMNTKIEWIKVFALHGKVILAMVLLIVGVVHEILDHTTTAPGTAKVGAILLLLCGALLWIWATLSFNQIRRANLPTWNDGTMLLYTVVSVLPFITLRTLYTVITVFSTGSFKNNLAAKVCMSVVPEMLLVAILALRGIQTRNIGERRKERTVEGRMLEGSEMYTAVRTSS